MDMDATRQPQRSRFREYKRWFLVSLYIVFLLVGQSAATLLGNLYYDKGGNSKWMATFVQSAGFPVLIPLLFYFSQRRKPTSDIPKTKPSVFTFALLYLAFGLLLTGDNLMYSYGLLYLPVSTYSLLCATQLAFNALFSYFLNSQKFSPPILNSLVLLTISASLLAVNSDSEESKALSKIEYIIGFLCTLGASAAYSLYLSLVQLSFEKVIKAETFSSVLNMQFYPNFLSTCGCVVGLFASGEWKTLNNEMKEYQTGRVSYIMTLVWTAVTWQVSTMGMLGLILEVSSLFSNVIGTVSLPVVPILSIFFFHDRINGVKVASLLLALWGFISYIYQHYLDDQKAKAAKRDSVEVPHGHLEIC
ncbi:probable purine permease 10 [Neltuma alba]|uniref:probable purine permease 10 n=1 Tax=Neltuma alba TaxID=207710 RepID=UPI0010A46375|nr:probable purine permease 10 [Prosopis alba]XP_028762461.1 probable purine permease 10 [Prosopis alba]XP_028762462.1 probable purine permease 10 [Prosopis alba]XP_028762463.1 probable purine permease 10 [Prosopis alba]XP_028762464.1 probable purine permease 10 [Prosopis alba]XP_028762465.1 probable purine permease 10 [Prosopis alba]XP_028762466.1 probable purine permease 10 [Prosopis alba]